MVDHSGYKSSDLTRFFQFGFHPANLIVRFLLEIALLASFAVWTIEQLEGTAGIILAFLAALAVATLWGVFAVRGDRSRSGKTVVATPCKLRIGLEFLLFGMAIWMNHDLSLNWVAVTLFFMTFLHYAISIDRLEWLWNN